MNIVLKLFLICAFFSHSIQLVSARYIFMTSLYNEQDPERLSEYITCLIRNSQNRHIKKVHVVYDTTDDNDENLIREFLVGKNITATLHQGRPSFQFFFDLANQLYPNETVIVSNADIYFNETLANLEKINLNNIFIALTRWEKKADGLVRPSISDKGSAIHTCQDSWIFKTPIAVQHAHVPLGTDYCEHELYPEIAKAGLKLLNPCLSLICCRLPWSTKRDYPSKPLPAQLHRLPWCYFSKPQYRHLKIEF